MKTKLQSYSNQDLSRAQIRELAHQYDGIDMTELLGADENNFPFIVRIHNDEPIVMMWNKPNGMMAVAEDDPVRLFATIQYLRDNAYPEFGSLEEAKEYACNHNWPLDPL